MKTWFNDKFVPTMGKLGNQRHLSAIRDGFAIFTPILIVGAMAILFNSSIFSGAWGGNTKGSLTALWTYFNGMNVTSGGHYQQFLLVMHTLFAAIQIATIQMMSVYVAFAVGYFIASSRRNSSPVIAGLVTLAAFLSVTPLMPGGYAGWQGGTYWLSANGLISALIVSLVAGELFSWLSKGTKLEIKMPDGVPPAVSRAFAKLFPAMITVGAFAALSVLVFWMPFYLTDTTRTTSMALGTTTQTTITGAIDAEHIKSITGLASFKDVLTQIDPNGHITSPIVLNGLSQDDLALVQRSGVHFVNTGITTQLPLGDTTLTTVIFAAIVNPFVGAASSTGGALGFAFAYVILISFFWFFGLHGTNIVNGAFQPLWLILLAANINGAQNVFVQGTFDAFIFIGGWGASLALVIATLIFGRGKTNQGTEISKFALAPGLFNINEPVTFGYPLILNGFMVVPLFLVMPVLVFTTYAATAWFGVPVTTVMMPWTTPVGFGGMIATGSGWGFVLALVNLAIAFAIYSPFVIASQKFEEKNAKKLAAAAKKANASKTVKA